MNKGKNNNNNNDNKITKLLSLDANWLHVVIAGSSSPSVNNVQCSTGATSAFYNLPVQSLGGSSTVPFKEDFRRFIPPKTDICD